MQRQPRSGRRRLHACRRRADPSAGHRRRPDAIVGYGETRIHSETTTFELQASEVASPRPSDQLTVGAETFMVKGEPQRRDPDRLARFVDVRPA